MEKLANYITENISRELGFDQEKKEVIAYGMFAVLHTLLTIGVTAILGFVFGVFIETMLVSFSIAILRKYSGGAHAESPWNCTIISALIAAGLASLIVYIVSPLINFGNFIGASVIAFVWSFYLIYKFAPVDSLAKPIRTDKKKQKMKKMSFKILFAYIGLMFLNVVVFIMNRENRILTFSLCIYGGMTWQAFSLTVGGKIFIERIDVFLNKVIKF